jgi:hypothetical protein
MIVKWVARIDHRRGGGGDGFPQDTKEGKRTTTQTPILPFTPKKILKIKNKL